MCWRPKIVIPMEYAERRLLSFAINDYQGSVNDLRGCINDSRHAKDVFLSHWPDFDIRRFLDYEATVRAFNSAVASAIMSLKPGATVAVLSDSCFSSTNTRAMRKRGVGEGHIPKNRFYATPGEPIIPFAQPFFMRSDIKWIAISACGETQTAADAFINDAYHGAFSWTIFRLLNVGMTWRQWFNETRRFLPSDEFDQEPTLEGPEHLLDTLVCSGNTLIIHNSTHGTTLRGRGEDAVDQAIVLYDGNLRDKDYFALLSKVA